MCVKWWVISAKRNPWGRGPGGAGGRNRATKDSSMFTFPGFLLEMGDVNILCIILTSLRGGGDWRSITRALVSHQRGGSPRTPLSGWAGGLHSPGPRNPVCGPTFHILGLDWDACCCLTLLGSSTTMQPEHRLSQCHNGSCWTHSDCFMTGSHSWQP